MLQYFPVFRKIIHQKFECLITDFRPPVFCVLRPGSILIVIPEIDPYGMVFEIYVFRIINPKDFSDPVACFRRQQDQ